MYLLTNCLLSCICFTKCLLSCICSQIACYHVFASQNACYHVLASQIAYHKLLVIMYSSIDFYSYSCLHPLSNERKSMFKSGDSRAVWTWVWTWKYLKWALHYLHDVIYGNHCGPDWSFRQCFCSQKHCVRFWHCVDVMTFESIQPMPFCLEKSSVKMDN